MCKGVNLRGLPVSGCVNFGFDISCNTPNKLKQQKPKKIVRNRKACILEPIIFPNNFDRDGPKIRKQKGASISVVLTWLKLDIFK